CTDRSQLQHLAAAHHGCVNPPRCEASVYMVKGTQTKQEGIVKRTVTIALSVLCLTSPVWAAGGGELPTPKPKSKATPPVSGEAKYNEGLAFTHKQDWRRAEAAYREAIVLKPELPEAWNELGHALKNEGRFEESVAAYQEALRLRPNYPQALEYLGEAYILM